MAPFMFPTARDAEHAEELWRMARRYAAEATHWDMLDTRIRALAWERRHRTFRAVVGRRFNPTGDTAMAIFETADRYLVITPSRGFLRGLPILVGKREITTIELFDALANDPVSEDRPPT